MTKYNLVIFDCDGTLVVSEEANNRAISRATKKIGLKGYDADICLQKFRGYGSEQIVNILREENNNYIDEEAFIAAIKQMSESLLDEIKAVLNVDLVLEKLTLDKCVVSNGERQNVIASLKQNNLLDFFTEANIFTCMEDENAKPAPDMFIRAAKKFSCPTNQAIVIEDSEAGVKAAKAAGMTAVGFIGTAIIEERRKAKLLASGADFIINDIKELLNIIS